MLHWRPLALASIATMLVNWPPATVAQKQYDPGASDTEIKIGQTMPYSGPASAFGTIGRAEAAYFKKLNEEGGVNGRLIKVVSLDDGYSPPKTVEATRRLVEQDQVLLMFGSLGTPQNSAVHAYLNSQKVPQLFVASGASKWNDPKGHPWTMGWQPNYQTEAQVYARHILLTKPNAKIGVLYQNDDFGKDYLKGLRDGLGDRAASMIVAEVTYEINEPTIDSQIIQLRNAGADVFVDISAPKAASQAIRRAYDLGWKAVHYLPTVSASVGGVLKPAGLDKSVGLITSRFNKDPTDPTWDADPGMVLWRAFMKKYYPDGDLTDSYNVTGYGVARTLIQVLKQCGDILTRDNVMKQAQSLKDFDPGTLMPGIRINTGPTDHAPLKAMQMARFDGKTWVRFGDVLGN